MKNRIGIFGAQNYWSFEHLKDEGFEVVAFIDNDKLKQGHKIDNIPIIGLQQIKDFNIEFIFLNSQTNKEQMYNDLVALNLPKLKVIYNVALKTDDYYNITGENNNISIINEEEKKESISAKINNIGIEIIGSNNNITFGKGVLVNGFLNIIIKGNNINIHIGNNVIINRDVHCIFQPQIGSVPDNSSLSIGDNCFLNGQNIYFEFGEKDTHIKIGKNCLFAYSIKLTTTDSHTIYDLDTKKRLNKPGDITIGDHCWICGEVTILNNTKVSDNSVIGIKSLVTKEFLEPNCLIAGVPAKIYRRNINWDNKIDSGIYLD